MAWSSVVDESVTRICRHDLSEGVPAVAGPMGSPAKRSSFSVAFGNRTKECDNVQRFTLAGAAQRPLREDSTAGIRAGERKTC
jgi:hypothetical protein